jgi:D-threo-aldose 1-dehydrogenase
MAKVAKIEKVCAEFNVPLPAAALQFVVAHPAVPSFIAGTRTVEQLNQNLDWFTHPIPKEFWATLKKHNLMLENAPVP